MEKGSVPDGKFRVIAVRRGPKNIGLTLYSPTYNLRLTLDAEMKRRTRLTPFSSVGYTMWPHSFCCGVETKCQHPLLSSIISCPKCDTLLDRCAHVGSDLTYLRNAHRRCLRDWMTDRTGVLEAELYVDEVETALDTYVRGLQAYLASVNDDIKTLNTIAQRLEEPELSPVTYGHFQRYANCLDLDTFVSEGKVLLTCFGAVGSASAGTPITFRRGLSYSVCGGEPLPRQCPLQVDHEDTDTYGITD